MQWGGGMPVKGQVRKIQDQSEGVLFPSAIRGRRLFIVYSKEK